jgi:long-chain acyl-CoA synthetase
MQGYYKNPEATRTVIDESSWLHTGDLGEFTSEGFLTITGSKKDLFKLSTGKYVIPQPLEDRVKQSSLVAQAVVVGIQKKFCGMLIFPNRTNLLTLAKTWGWYLPTDDLLKQPEIVALYQTLVDEANEQLPRWSRVKRFGLVNADLSVANELLHQDSKVNRAKVNEIFATEINALYGEDSVLISELESLTESKGKPQIILQAKNYLPRLNFFFWLINGMHSLYPKFQTILNKAKSISVGHSLKRLTRKAAIKARLFWKRIKNYISLPSAMPWKLPEENNNSEEIESIEGRKV